jgi:hypothetical protein
MVFLQSRISFSLRLYSPSDLGRFFSFLILYIFGRTPWTGYRPVARPLTTQTQNKSTHIFTPRVGFEPTTLVFERAKTVHALDRAATVIGTVPCISQLIPSVLMAVYNKILKQAN